MTGIPRPALILGCLGLLPFLYGAAMTLVAAGTLPTLGLFPSDPVGGLTMLERFGAVILGFMGGCLWGFASARPNGPSLPQLAASILPAALAFLAIRENPALSCIWLAFGFVALQTIDVAFHRAGVAPAYWLALRLPLTAIVLACLLLGGLNG